MFHDDLYAFLTPFCGARRLCKNLCAKILYFYNFVSYQMCPLVTRKLKVKKESLIS